MRVGDGVVEIEVGGVEIAAASFRMDTSTAATAISTTSIGYVTPIVGWIYILSLGGILLLLSPGGILLVLLVVWLG